MLHYQATSEKREISHEDKNKVYFVHRFQSP